MSINENNNVASNDEPFCGMCKHYEFTVRNWDNPLIGYGLCNLQHIIVGADDGCTLFEPNRSNTDVSSVASHSCTDGNSIEQGKETLVISAFPGTGKTHLSKLVNALDSDSSGFSWLPKTKIRNGAFPFNYIQHIKRNIGKYDFIFVSSHKEVRTCMVQYGIDFLSAYPQKQLKQEYLKRFKDRGNDEWFISMMDKNWDCFIDGMSELQVMPPLVMKSGEYLADYFLLNNGQGVKECDATMPNSSNEDGSIKKAMLQLKGLYEADNQKEA